MNTLSLEIRNPIDARQCKHEPDTGRLQGPPRGPERPSNRIGLVLGGGGMKAVAHIGVLRVLKQAGVEPEIIASSSAGSLVALFYCAGYSPDRMVEILSRELSGGWLARICPFYGVARLAWLLRGGGLRQLIAKYVIPGCLEHLPIPLLVSTTDLINAESVVFDRGSIANALLASMSLPGLSQPVRYDGRLLVDGSILNDLPVEHVRNRGADFTIAVDLNGVAGPRNWGPIQQRAGASRIIGRALLLQQQLLATHHARCADVVLRPELDEFNFTDFNRLEEMIRLGEQAARSALPKILAGIEHERGCRGGYPT